jgi:hypothetical protein
VREDTLIAMRISRNLDTNFGINVKDSLVNLDKLDKSV